MEVPCLRAVTPVEKDSKQGTSAAGMGFARGAPFKRILSISLLKPLFCVIKKKSNRGFSKPAILSGELKRVKPWRREW